jgi:hypothetical protein
MSWWDFLSLLMATKPSRRRIPSRRDRNRASPGDFSTIVRQKAGSQAVLERVAIGIRRILNVLEREQIAGIRTLEMKICDAGPLPLRVEPHVLGLAGLELLNRNRVAVHQHPLTDTHSWYAPIRLPEAVYRQKLASLVETYLATTNATFTHVLGDPLEITVFKILREMKLSEPRFTYLGSFNLAARFPDGRFRKTEPAINYNEAVLDGPPIL